MKKNRYTLRRLNGESQLTQQKMNNPNKPRRQKSFLARDFQRVNKADVSQNMDDNFDIHKALKSNVVQDRETDNRQPPRPKPVRIRREPIVVEPRKRSTRVRKPNCMLQDFVETNDEGKITKELGKGFVLIGGIKNLL